MSGSLAGPFETGVDAYRRLLWGSMDLLGVRESVEQKFVVAMATQFLSVLALLALPVVFLGPREVLAVFPTAQLVATAIVVCVAALAFVNTIWVLRRDVLKPVVELRDIARDISRGNLENRPDDPVQVDETGELKGAFVEMHEYLSTVAEQAEALQREEFDDAVLAQDVPGEFGDALAEMQETLEERLRELRTYQAAVEHAGHGIYVTDTDETIEYVNPAFEEITGYSAEEAVGQTPRILQSGEMDEEYYQRLWETLSAGEVWEAEVIDRREDGERIVVDQTIAPIKDDDGEINGYVAVQQDITVRKQYETELEQKTKQLEVLNRVIRHDITNDVNVIYGWAQLLEGHVDDEGEEALETILETSERIMDLAETVKEFLDALVEREKLDLGPVDLESVLRAEIRSQRNTYPGADVSLEGELPSVSVRANELLSSVFQNLLRNAVEHNDKDTPRIRVSVSEDKETATVRVADNGPGVPDEKKAEIFGQDEKGIDSTGTGIGLFLASVLVDRYDGEIRVEDREIEWEEERTDGEPEGAVFVVELPKIEQSQPLTEGTTAE